MLWGLRILHVPVWLGPWGPPKYNLFTLGLRQEPLSCTLGIAASTRVMGGSGEPGLSPLWCPHKTILFS